MKIIATVYKTIKMEKELFVATFAQAKELLEDLTETDFKILDVDHEVDMEVVEER